ncbi:MAG TPA: hypothetical protein VFP05_11020 [Thermomicrobiales bacterium]|nr:hypothetical protein [Thermomicrobiales bacterium]
MRRWLVVSLVLFSLIGGFGTVGAEDDAFPAMPLDELGLPEIVVSTDGATMTAPTALEAGRYFLQVDNDSPAASVAVELYRAPEGAAAADLIPGFQDAAGLDQPPPDFYEMLIAGGVSTEAGGRGEAVIDLPAGSWIVAAYVYGNGADGLLTQAIEVSGDIGDPDDPDADIDLNFEDFAFDLDERVPAGDQVWELENDGEQPHFVSIYSYGGELTEAAVNAALFDAYGTAPQPVDPEAIPIDLGELVEVGGSGTMSAGTEAWLQLDLPVGTYLALCQVVDRESGLPHAALGQLVIFTVE